MKTKKEKKILNKYMRYYLFIVHELQNHLIFIKNSELDKISY